MSDKKITFRKYGYFLIAKDGWKKAVIAERSGKFHIEFFIYGDILCAERADTISEAKELARRFIRGRENQPEITGKG